MSIVMVSSKTKEEILAGIKALLVQEASTEENLKKARTEAEKTVEGCQETAAKIAEIKAKINAMADFDDEEKQALIDTRLKKAGFKAHQENVPSIEEVEQYNLAQLVAESQVVAQYEKWAGIFGLESKKSVGRPAAGGDKEHKAESKFEGQWSRELTNGAQCVNFRLLTDEQKTRNNLTNATQWIVKVGDKVQVVEATAPNNLIMVAKLLLGQSVASGVNNSTWNDGQELTAAQIANF